MNKEQKSQKYEEVLLKLNSLLENETDLILKMSSINSILKNEMEYYFWVGFYIVDGEQLRIGPYQGTLGCLYITFEKGICGRAARTRTTQIVGDVHKDTEHIACDSKSNSEIVVPVFDSSGRLIAVLDVDSTEFSAFDETDSFYLEQIVQTHFEKTQLTIDWKW